MTRLSRVLAAGAVAAVIAGLLLGAVASASAQTTPVAPGRPELQQLKSRVESRFQVMVLRRGMVLVPKQGDGSYNNIELADDGLVLIDGTAVTGRELRSRMPADADAVAQLSFLDAAARRELFAPKVPVAPRAPVPPEPPAIAVPEVPEVPQLPRPDEGWVERERIRRGGARVRIGGDVTVHENESVGDAVVAVLGSATVDGQVDGNVVAVLGNVKLGPRADVRGSVVAVGGAVERATGSRVDGDVTEVKVADPTFGPFVRIRPWREWRWFTSPFGAWTDLFASLMRMALIGLLAALLVAVAGTPVRRVAGVAATEPWRAALAGLAAQLFFVPLLVITIVVLVVSIIGIPLLLLVPFGLLAVLVALVMGFTGVGCAIGEAIARRSGRGLPNLLTALVVGLAVVWSLTVIARFAGLAGTPVRVIMGFVLGVGFLVEYVAWTVGLGAVLISRFGRVGPTSVVPPSVPAFDIGTPPAETV